MRRLPKNFISWSKIAPSVFYKLYRVKYPYNPINPSEEAKEAMRIGKERHMNIQDVVSGYSEFTPAVRFYDKVLLGHVDIIDFQDNGDVYLYEIKSRSFYEKYSKFVECQLSFYYYLTKKFLEINQIHFTTITPLIILYYKEKWEVVNPQYNLEKLERVWREVLKEVE